jgi:hypothetical protein
VTIDIPVGAGELVDKISILEIKRQRLRDPRQLANVAAELALLATARDRWVAPSEELSRLAAGLKMVNLALWDIEDDIRDCERAGDFGPRFIELARSVYRRNDERALLKRQINELLRSSVIEEKSYRSY